MCVCETLTTTRYIHQHIHIHYPHGQIHFGLHFHISFYVNIFYRDYCFKQITHKYLLIFDNSIKFVPKINFSKEFPKFPKFPQNIWSVNSCFI